MMIIPRFFKNPFIILIYLFCRINIMQRNTIFFTLENKNGEKFIFFAIETALYPISLYLLLSISLMTFSQFIFEVRE